MLQTKRKTAPTVVAGLAILGVLGYAFEGQLAGSPEGKDKPTPGADGGTPKLHPVLVQDFEKPTSLPRVWAVGIPNENAAVQLSTDHPSEGKQSLKLHYHFTGGGWPVDLSRYNGLADMYVDYVRVYQQER